MHQADKLFNKGISPRINGNNQLIMSLVKGPQEATLDSHFLLMASSIGAQKARAMKSGSGAFDVDEFISKLVTFMGGGKSLGGDQSANGTDEDDEATMDWEKIGRKALAKSRRVPVMGFM